MADPAVYRSSRLSGGNLLFPDRIRLEDETVVFEKRHLIGGQEESIRYEQIASVSVQRGFLFADLLFENTGGDDPVFLNGLWKRTAERIKSSLEARLRQHRTSGEDKLLAALDEQTQLLRQILAAVQKG